MMTTASIWNNAAAQSSPSLSAHPADSSSGAATPADSSATIGANDFLTLLVTEMQNQDPTASTDPNEYVNQLVSVNSLEQLIQINQTLQGAAASTGQSNPVTAPNAQPAPVSNSQAAHNTTFAHTSDSMVSRISGTVTGGNLGAPGINPAAERVAQSLGGRAHL